MKYLRLFAVALAFLLAPLAAQSAVSTNSFVTLQTPILSVVQFLQGTDSPGTYKTLVTGGTNGSKIIGLIATTNDASASHLLTCQLVRSAVSYGGVAITISTNSGFANATPPVNLMTSSTWPGLPIDSDGNPFLYLSGTGDTLQCTFATALTSTDVINVIAIVGNF